MGNVLQQNRKIYRSISSVFLWAAVFPPIHQPLFKYRHDQKHFRWKWHCPATSFQIKFTRTNFDKNNKTINQLQTSRESPGEYQLKSYEQVAEIFDFESGFLINKWIQRITRRSFRPMLRLIFIGCVYDSFLLSWEGDNQEKRTLTCVSTTKETAWWSSLGFSCKWQTSHSRHFSFGSWIVYIHWSFFFIGRGAKVSLPIG